MPDDFTDPLETLRFAGGTGHLTLSTAGSWRRAIQKGELKPDTMVDARRTSGLARLRAGEVPELKGFFPQPEIDPTSALTAVPLAESSLVETDLSKAQTSVPGTAPVVQTVSPPELSPQASTHTRELIQISPQPRELISQPAPFASHRRPRSNAPLSMALAGLLCVVVFAAIVAIRPGVVHSPQPPAGRTAPVSPPPVIPAPSQTAPAPRAADEPPPPVQPPAALQSQARNPPITPPADLARAINGKDSAAKVPPLPPVIIVQATPPAPKSAEAEPAPPPSSNLEIPTVSEVPPGEDGALALASNAITASVCNRTVAPILVSAVHMPIGDHIFWKSAGYWRINANQCRQLFNTQNHFFYLHIDKLIGGTQLIASNASATGPSQCLIHGRSFSFIIPPKYLHCPETSELDRFLIVHGGVGDQSITYNFYG